MAKLEKAKTDFIWVNLKNGDPTSINLPSICRKAAVIFNVRKSSLFVMCLLFSQSASLPIQISYSTKLNRIAINVMTWSFWCHSIQSTGRLLDGKRLHQPVRICLVPSPKLLVGNWSYNFVCITSSRWITVVARNCNQVLVHKIEDRFLELSEKMSEGMSESDLNTKSNLMIEW